MLSLNDLMNEISTVREVFDNIEVKGKKNSELITFGYDKCEKIITELKDAIEEIVKSQAEEKEQEIEVVPAPTAPPSTPVPLGEPITFEIPMPDIPSKEESQET